MSAALAAGALLLAVAPSAIAGTPKFTVSTTSLDFGTVQVGHSATLGVTITNTTVATEVIANAGISNNLIDTIGEGFTFGPQIDGGYANASGPGFCGTAALWGYGTRSDAIVGAIGNPVTRGVLGPGESCTFLVSFTPDRPGQSNRQLRISTFEDPGSPYAIDLLGAGDSGGAALNPDQIIYDPPEVIDIGISPIEIGASRTGQAAFSNTGASAITISDISAGGDFAVSATTCGTLPATLAAGASCSIDVTFSPTAVGLRSAALSVASTASGGPRTSYLLGSGKPASNNAAHLELSTTTLDFGAVPVVTGGGLLPVTVTNTGSSPALISDFGVAGTFLDELGQQFTFGPQLNGGFFGGSLGTTCGRAQTGGAGGQLDPGSSCVITVGFHPSAEGSRKRWLNIYSDADNGKATVELIGSGGVPHAQLDPNALGFTGIAVGGSAQATVNLENVGTAPLQVTNVATTGDFSATTSCPSGTSTLAAGASCPIIITASPTAPGNRAGQLQVDTTAHESSVRIPLNVAAHALVISPTSVTVPTAPVGVGSTSDAITLRNASSTPVVLQSVSVTGEFSTSLDTCLFPVTLPPGYTCTYKVRMTATAEGTRTGSLNFAYQDLGGNQSDSVSLSGVATTIRLTATSYGPGNTASSLAFDPQPVGTASSAKLVLLENGSGGNLAITSAAVTGDFRLSGTCGSVVAPHTNCYFYVSFAPTAAGPRSGAFTLTSPATGSPHVISLSGEGAVGVASFDPAAMVFATQGIGVEGPAQSVFLSNTGTAPLGVISASLSGPNAADYRISLNRCNNQMAIDPGYSCQMMVVHKPTATGTRIAQLDFLTTLQSAPYAVPLSSSGARVTIDAAYDGRGSSSSIDFGSGFVPGQTSSSEFFQVTNSGASPLQISTITVDGQFVVFDPASQACPHPGALAPGDVCYVGVRYKPTAWGRSNGDVFIADNVANSPQRVPVTGMAEYARFSRKVVDFGNVAVGATATQLVTVSNIGTAAFYMYPSSWGGIGFGQPGGCFAVWVSPGSSCTLTLSFTPPSEGSFSGTVHMYTTDFSGQQIDLAGTGARPHVEPFGDPEFKTPPTPLDFDTVQIGATSPAQSVFLVNQGMVDADVTVFGALAPNGDPHPDFTVTDDCPKALPASPAFCTIGVTFSPSREDKADAELVIGTNDLDHERIVVPLTGFGATNQKPTVTAGSYTVPEGGSVILSAAGSDPEGGALTYAWDVDGDGTFTAPGQTYTFDASRLDGPSAASIAVRVTDDAGNTAEDTASITITNEPPTATLDAPAAADEGSQLSLTIDGAVDPGIADTDAGFMYAFDCGDASGFGTPSADPTATCQAGPDGALHVQGKVIDKDGGASTYTRDVAVANVAPSVASVVVSPASTSVGDAVLVSATYADPGPDDAAFTCTVDYGDGTAPEVGTASGGTCAASGHVFGSAGTKTVTVRVTDGDGGTGSASATHLVDPLSVLGLGPVSVTEGNSGTTNAVFTITLSPSSTGTVTVKVATADVEAKAGPDYVALPATTVTFAPGTTSKTVGVAVRGDALDEPNERFRLDLSAPTNASIASPGFAYGTIVDDDAPPSLAVNDVTVTEGNTGTVTAVFKVTLSAPSGQPVTVTAATADAEAMAGPDYVALPPTVFSVPAGAVSVDVVVQVKGDTVPEPTETYKVNLSASTSATIADGLGIGTIVDDDALLIEENDPAVRYIGSWTRVQLAGASGGHVSWARTTGALATVTFSGRSVQLVSVRGPDRGLVAIFLDTTTVPTVVNLYAPTQTSGYVAYSRAFTSSGTHTLRMVVLGIHAPPSTGNRVDLDVVRVLR